MAGSVFAADELYQHAGEKGDPHADPDDPPRRRAKKGRGHGTDETDRPPIVSIGGGTSGEVRSFGREHAEGATCREVLARSGPAGAATLDTDEGGGYWAVEAKRQRVHGSVKSFDNGPGTLVLLTPAG